jgi:hypothetical protein
MLYVHSSSLTRCLKLPALNMRCPVWPVMDVNEENDHPVIAVVHIDRPRRG